MELRKLQASDIFAMLKILNGIGIKQIKNAIDTDAIKNARERIKNASETGEDQQAIMSEIGTDIMMSVLAVVIENLPKIETDLYNFLGSIADLKPKDIAKMDAGDFTDLIVAVVKKDDFLDFFKRASKLIK